LPWFFFMLKATIRKNPLHIPVLQFELFARANRKAQ